MPPPLTLTLSPSLEATHVAKGNKHFLALHYLCITLARGGRINRRLRLRAVTIANFEGLHFSH